MAEVLPPRDDVLPGDATPLERALADTDGRLDAIDGDLVRRAKSHAAAPAAFLPALAWERSVDVWDPAWPEAVKRAVIAVAPAVHAHKGTRFAIRAALDALGVSVEIVEWWQTVPRGEPYTFVVTAYARDRIYTGNFVLDPRLIQAIHATILRTKPASRAFALTVGAAFTAPLGVAAAGAGTVKLRGAVHVPARIPVRGALGLAAVGVARVTHRAAITLRAAP